jgi:hypothetical protein
MLAGEVLFHFIIEKKESKRVKGTDCCDKHLDSYNIKETPRHNRLADDGKLQLCLNTYIDSMLIFTRIWHLIIHP